MLTVSLVCVLLCLSIRVNGSSSLKPPGSTELVGLDDKPLDQPGARLGRMSLGFGLLKLNLFRDIPSEVHFLQVLLAKWVAGAIGTLLALDLDRRILARGFATRGGKRHARQAGLAQGFFIREISWRARVYDLPLRYLHRRHLAGAGARTGVWNAGYLLALPILIAHFTVIYSASVLLAVCTRNTIVSAFGSIVFWGICFGFNFGRHALQAIDAVKNPNSSHSRFAQGLVEVGYWILPKPADFLMVLDRALDSGAHFEGFAALENAANLPLFSPALSIAASLVFAAVMFLISTREFASTDY